MRNKETAIKVSLIIAISILLALSAAFVAVGYFGGHFESAETLQAYVSSFGIWGPIVLTLIQLLQVIVPVVPGFVGCVVGADLFGALGGFLVNYIGISAGSIGAYYLARRFGIKLVSKMINLQKHEKYIERLRQSPKYTTVLFLSILLPLAPDDFLCYFSGLIDMKPKKFIAVILLAKPWCILIYSIFFAYVV